MFRRNYGKNRIALRVQNAQGNYFRRCNQINVSVFPERNVRTKGGKRKLFRDVCDCTKLCFSFARERIFGIYLLYIKKQNWCFRTFFLHILLPFLFNCNPVNMVFVYTSNLTLQITYVR